jgi:hypothetical protein
VRSYVVVTSHVPRVAQIKEFEFDFKRLCEFNEVGAYRITAKREIWALEGRPIFTVVSNPLCVSVVHGRWESHE